MPIKLDLAGLNSLIYENVTSSTNTIGGNLVAIGDKSESLASLETTTVSNAYLRGPVYSNALRMPNTLTEQEAFLSQTGSTVTGYSTTGGFSLTTWLKLDAAAHISEGTADTRTLFAAYGTGSVNNDFSFKIEITGSDLRVNVYQSGSLSSKVATYTSTVNTTNLSNDWHHIGFTFNGNLSDATGGTIYLNAVSQSLTYAAAGGVAGTSRKDFKNIYLFDRGRAQTTNELQGAMQELATWNTTLSLTNIQDVSASTNLNSLGIAGNMIDYWKLGEEPALNQYAWEQPDSLPASTVIASSLTSPNNNLTASVGFKFSQGRYIVGNPFTSYTVAGGFSYSFWARLPAETSVEERRVWRGSSVSQYAAFSGTNFRAVFQGTSQFFHQWDISDINQQEWNHYVLTWRGDFAESPALYVNKQFKGFGVFILPHPGATDVPDSIDSLYVLDDPKGGTDRELKGELQDLAFYGKELSTSEVSELYGIGIIRPDYSSLSFQASILDYWSFGDETELNSYSVDQTIPNGTTVRSTLGHQNYLTVKENIVKKNGHFQPYYNIMNIGLNAAVDPRAHLAALNIHRGGLYGYSTFKQVRSSQNPLSRLHKANSIFSYVKEGGDYIQQKVGTQLVAFRERKGALTNITESAVISSHKPITLVGTTIDDDDDSTQTRVEIKASFSNENQFFGNEKANRDFGLSFDVVDDYEELTDLYLEGGLDQDFSPIEEFEVLKYSQTIFPKAGNSYLDEVRTRKNYTNTFWRDLRTNRTQVGTINNNFGFTIPSQSLWPLDVEQNWAARSFGATVGSFTIQTPCSLAFNMTSASADGIEFSNADIHIWNEQAQATAPGTDTGFVADDTSAPFDFKIRGERFSFNSKEGNERFWDGWALALRDAGFSSVSHTPNAFDLRSGYSAERFNNPVSDKYYLQVNPLSFNEANWKSDFNFMMLYFWFRNLSATTKGYLYREVDSDGNNRRSVYFDGNQIQVQVSTVFESLDEDRNATAQLLPQP